MNISLELVLVKTKKIYNENTILKGFYPIVATKWLMMPFAYSAPAKKALHYLQR